MKSLRDEMEIVNAYELMGTYRGAAVLCGTTAKTVKRVLERLTTSASRRPSVIRPNVLIRSRCLASMRVKARPLIPAVAEV